MSKKSAARSFGKAVFNGLVAVGEAMEEIDRNNSNNTALEGLIRMELDNLGYAESLVIIARDGAKAHFEKRSYGPIQGRVVGSNGHYSGGYFLRDLTGPITCHYSRYLDMPGVGIIGQVKEIRVEKWGRKVRTHTIDS